MHQLKIVAKDVCEIRVYEAVKGKLFARVGTADADFYTRLETLSKKFIAEAKGGRKFQISLIKDLRCMCVEN